jgi:Arc/MetJ-type ribon-helix-helix transcriptional regulator
MPPTSSSKQQVVPVRITPALRRQLDELIAAGFGTQADIVRIAVDRMHRNEINKQQQANKENKENDNER